MRQKIQDQMKKMKFLALGYSDNKISRRYTFIFDKKTEKLITKSIDIVESDSESNLDFWKFKYPDGNFKLESKITSYGHYSTTDEWINVNKNLILSISKNKVIQASWNK